MIHMNDKHDVQTFGAFLRKHREDKGYTVRGFAAKLGITPSYLSDLEKDNRAAPRSSASSNLLERICEMLITTDEDKHRYYDLAAESRDGQYDELNNYLRQHANARLALRVARDQGIGESDWGLIAQDIKSRDSSK